MPGLGRYCEFGGKGNGRWRGADRLVRVLRLQYLVQRPFQLVLAAESNDCLVQVSVSTAAHGHRQQPLRTRRLSRPLCSPV